MVKGFSRMADLERKRTVRSSFVRGRHLEQMDWSQLPSASQNTLCDENGVFYFTIGYSTVGNGDRVRP